MDIGDHLGIDRNSAVPLETQLTRQLTRLIAAGEVQPGDRLPPIRTLAAQLDINRQTVRAAYGRLGSQGLVDARQGRGTTVISESLQGLGAARPDHPTFTIGVILPAFAPFYAPMFDGMRHAAETDPSQILICDSSEDPTAAARYLRQLVARDVDGIIIVSQRLPEDLDLPLPGLPPMVFADWPGSPEPSIVFDTSTVAEAIRHLIAHGHERIGLISPPAEFPNMRLLIDGHRRALEDAGLPYDTDLVAEVSDFTLESGDRALQVLVTRPRPPTAALTASASLAFGVLQGTSRLGLAVPDDFAIIGFGDIQAAALVNPPLTTVTLPAREMGTQAMATLRSMIAAREPQTHRTVTLPTRLTVRRSCGPHNQDATNTPRLTTPGPRTPGLEPPLGHP